MKSRHSKSPSSPPYKDDFGEAHSTIEPHDIVTRSTRRLSNYDLAHHDHAPTDIASFLDNESHGGYSTIFDDYPQQFNPLPPQPLPQHNPKDSFLSQFNHLSQTVVALSFTSLFNSIGSEMLSVVLPLYMNKGLNMPNTVIGLVEGFSYVISAMMKIAAGLTVDYIHNHKWFTGLGYLLAAASRPCLLLSSSLSFIVFCRWIERVGKGLRSSPRDALVAKTVQKSNRSFSYSVLHAGQQFGCVFSLAFAIILLYLQQHVISTDIASSWKAIVYLSTPFGLFAVLSVVLFVHDDERDVFNEERNRNDGRGGNYYELQPLLSEPRYMLVRPEEDEADVITKDGKDRDRMDVETKHKPTTTSSSSSSVIHQSNNSNQVQTIATEPSLADHATSPSSSFHQQTASKDTPSSQYELQVAKTIRIDHDTDAIQDDASVDAHTSTGNKDSDQHYGDYPSIPPLNLPPLHICPSQSDGDQQTSTSTSMATATITAGLPSSSPPFQTPLPTSTTSASSTGNNNNNNNNSNEVNQSLSSSSSSSLTSSVKKKKRRFKYYTSYGDVLDEPPVITCSGSSSKTSSKGSSKDSSKLAKSSSHTKPSALKTDHQEDLHQGGGVAPDEHRKLRPYHANDNTKKSHRDGNGSRDHHGRHKDGKHHRTRAGHDDHDDDSTSDDDEDDETQQQPNSPFNSLVLSLILILCLGQLGTISSPFLVLLADRYGFSLMEILLLIFVYDVIYSGITTPAGLFTDRLNRRHKHGGAYTVAFGWCVRSMILIFVALSSSQASLVFAFIFYGAYSGLTEGIVKALLADVLPQSSKQLGSIFATFDSLVGLSDLANNAVAGYFFDKEAITGWLWLNGCLGLLACGSLLLWRSKIEPNSEIEEHLSLSSCIILNSSLLYANQSPISSPATATTRGRGVAGGGAYGGYGSYGSINDDYDNYSLTSYQKQRQLGYHDQSSLTGDHFSITMQGDPHHQTGYNTNGDISYNTTSGLATGFDYHHRSLLSPHLTTTAATGGIHPGNPIWSENDEYNNEMVTTSPTIKPITPSISTPACVRDVRVPISLVIDGLGRRPTKSDLLLLERGAYAIANYINQLSLEGQKVSIDDLDHENNILKLTPAAVVCYVNEDGVLNVIMVSDTSDRIKKRRIRMQRRGYSWK